MPEQDSVRAAIRIGQQNLDEVLARRAAAQKTRAKALASHPRAQELLRARADRMLKGPITADNIPVWRAAYSRPFYEYVEKAAAAEKIEPLFLLALVREESTFDPQIVSWAGAVGLAQLMPGTASGAHLQLGLGRLDLERLTDPELNLRLGAHVLHDGLKTFKNREPLALSPLRS